MNHGLAAVADAGAFLARLIRLDPGAPVRLKSHETAAAARPTGARTALWARLPWQVLVTREVAGAGPGDATVSAAELLAALSRGDETLPRRRDADWRWPLPPAGGTVVETVATAELIRLAAAAAGTLREVTAGGIGGRAVGQRAVRDALLDHIALVVTPQGGDAPRGDAPRDPEGRTLEAPQAMPPARPVEVPQRLVQAVARMGFLGAADDEGAKARVYVAGRWVGLSAPYGVAWLQSVKELTVMPITGHPNG